MTDEEARRRFEERCTWNEGDIIITYDPRYPHRKVRPMIDVLNTYFITVIDDVGVAHHIAIAKGKATADQLGSGQRLGIIEKALFEAKLQYARSVPSTQYCSAARAAAKAAHIKEGEERDEFLEKYNADVERRAAEEGEHDE